MRQSLPFLRHRSIGEKRDGNSATQKFRDKETTPLPLTRALRGARFPNIDCNLHGDSVVREKFLVTVHSSRRETMLECRSMTPRFQRFLHALDLEERILNAAVLFALVSIFFPWLSGEWLGGDPVLYSGFHFFTSFIGIIVFLLHVTLLSITLVPALGGPVFIKRRYREIVRLYLASQTTILVLAALSVLTKVTYESRVEIRFGIYFTLVGSLVATLYSFLKWQEQRKQEVQELFHHPEDHQPLGERSESSLPLPPPPPPPPPLEPEEHHLHQQ